MTHLSSRFFGRAQNIFFKSDTGCGTSHNSTALHFDANATPTIPLNRSVSIASASHKLDSFVEAKTVTPSVITDSDPSVLPINAALEVSHVSVRLGGSIVVDDVSFCVPQKTMYAIIGPNGAGKSTLLRAVIGLLPITHRHDKKAAVSVLGVPHHKASDSWRHRVAFVPQRADVYWQFPITVREVVNMGFAPLLRWWQSVPDKKSQARVDELLDLLGLFSLQNRRFSDLSGGQQQKTFLARTLAQNPRVIMLDEPFNGVDAPSIERILVVLKQFCNHGGSVVCVHHDLGLVREHFDQGILINTSVVASGSARHITSDAIRYETYYSHPQSANGQNVNRKNKDAH